jgi:anti-anti-sigma factor
MRIKRSDAGKIRVIACEGTMTLTGGADELVLFFDRVLNEGRDGIVLDLTRLAFLDSAGVGAVVSCGKRAAASGTVMKVALARTGPVRRIFEITQLERGFEIFDDAATAAASFP